MIDKLEMFMALAAERHFGRAAEVCGVTQPTLSSAIKQLEDQLGVQLVWRGSRFQGLTPEGLRVLDWARRIVGDARSLREEMRAVRAGLSGVLRLGVIPTALPMIARLTDRFTAAHPNVHLRIFSRTSAEILQEIEDLELDAGVTYLDNEPLGRVARVPLYSEGYRLLVSGRMDLAARDSIAWNELGEVPLCLLTPEMQNRRIVNHFLAEAGVAVSAPVESNSMIALLAHVATGRWASVVPEAMADLFASADFRAIPIRAPEVHSVVGLIAPWREPHTPLLEALLADAAKIATVGAGA
ncbi:LysR family transcriptional regulator [Acidimangrovimonas sediminis]|uniref:LysR family transcriptional regulator n=1 Tax=Acidimangrovimonas sediminis TaxID=2056283 RepID=UPI000C802E68|nr:LysR family transcriptional regulator [Acidimangrovimonas sediminis]